MGDWTLVPDQPITDIDLGGVFRKDLGDTGQLAESIELLGLLSPIVISSDRKLISGRRRIQAVQTLGWTTVPCWIVTEVTDEHTRIMAIRDNDALRKTLTPIEQAELYAAWEKIYAEQAKRRHQATRFNPETAAEAGAVSPSRNGVDDSSSPLADPSVVVPSRTKAAIEVTGSNSFQRLERIRELQAIANDDDQDPLVQQDARNALVELNHDGNVAPRWERVKLGQALTELENTAVDRDEPDPVRVVAAKHLDAVRSIRDQDTPKAALKESAKALKDVARLRHGQPKPAPAPVDPHAKQKQACRSLVAVLRRENGWWDRNDPAVFGEYADPAQWDFLTGYLEHATRFLDTAKQARSA